MGKPLGSAYHPGQRRDWIKVKNVKQQEVIICGWEPGEGRRADLIGSLLLGVNDDDGQLATQDTSARDSPTRCSPTWREQLRAAGA